MDVQPYSNKQHENRLLCDRRLPSHRGFAPGVRPVTFIVCSIVSLAKRKCQERGMASVDHVWILGGNRKKMSRQEL